MEIALWNVDLDVAPSAELLEWCLREHQVDRMLLILRVDRSRGRWVPRSAHALRRFEQLFGTYVLDRFLASGWPGTELFRKPVLINVLTFNETLKDLAIKAEPNLNKWNNNEAGLPEDLCLFRLGELHPIFVSVTHEGLAWLLTNKTPALRGVERCDVMEQGTLRQSLQVFPGKHYCRPWRGSLQAVDKRLSLVKRCGLSSGL